MNPMKLAKCPNCGGGMRIVRSWVPAPGKKIERIYFLCGSWVLLSGRNKGRIEIKSKCVKAAKARAKRIADNARNAVFNDALKRSLGFVWLSPGLPASDSDTIGPQQGA